MTTSTSTAGRGALPARPPLAFTRGLAAAGLPSGAVPGRPVTDADLAPLPPAAARYLRAMGVVGRPRPWSFRAHLTGRFRRGPGRPWMPLDAWQYNSAVEVARMFRMRLVVGHAVPMWGWDTYLRGSGRMRGRALGLVPVADGSGPEFDVGELTTWLDDAILFAPGMLVDPRTTWEATGEDGFTVAVTDAGRTVRAEVFLDEAHRPRDVRSHDRWADLPGGRVRSTWSTPVDGWTVLDGRPRMTGGAAVWLLPDGPYRYAELRPVDLALDVPP